MASRIVGGPKTRRMLKRFPAEAKTEVVKALDEAIRLVQASAVAGAPSREWYDEGGARVANRPRPAPS